MKLQLRKAFVCLLVLGSALLLMGASTDGEPQAPPVTGVVPVEGGVDAGWEAHHLFPGFQGIFRVDVAGSELGAIPEGAPMGSAAAPGYALPALSPDGTRLAFVARPSLVWYRAPRSWCPRSMGRMPAQADARREVQHAPSVVS